MLKIFKIIFILSISIHLSFSRGKVSKIFAHKESANSSSYIANEKTYKWGEGDNIVIDGFEYNGHRYNYISEAPIIKIRRSDNNNSTGEPCGLFAEKNSSSKYILSPTFPEGCDMAKVMGGRVINIGALDLFKNGNDNYDTPKNIERVDFISPNGIVAPSNASSLSKAGHVVTEKSGNNELKIAAILSLDANGNPSAFGPLVTVHDENGDAQDNRKVDYGDTYIYLNDNSIIGQQYLGFYRDEKFAPQTGKPTLTGNSHEKLDMAFVSLEDLGIDAGQKYYGFSYFPSDVYDNMDLVNYTSFPKNTPKNSLNHTDTADPYGGVASYFVDEEIIKVSIVDANITEGDSGTKHLNFTVTLDKPAQNGGVTVQVTPYNITANEGEDYTRHTSSIYFAQGESSKTIYYLINGDTKVEEDEKFKVKLHNPQNAILDGDRSEAVGTIINDDSEEECEETTLSLDISVSSSNDDAEEKKSNGDMYRNSSDLEMIQEHHEQIVGIRFQNIYIPKNATITNAYIQFSVDEKSSEATNLTIYGEATNNANSYSSSDYNISNRNKTSSSISWSPPAWNSIHQQGLNQRTPNLKDILQEIVDRDGWSSGNAVSFIITGSGKRVAESYDGESDKAPRLHIEYMGCPTDNNGTSTATCYALTDNSDRLYKVNMSPNANPLPMAYYISISKIFNGEGSAYRASNNKFYAFKANSDNSGPSDLYTIDIDTGTTTKIVDNIIDGTVDGAEFYFNPTLNREILYIISGENNSKLYAFDPDNWSLLAGYPKDTNTDLSSLAIDPINGVAYAIDDYNYDHKKPKVYRLNLATGDTTHITTLQHLADAEGLAFASDGNLYIEDEGRDDLNGKKLYMVNTQTGELTPSAITNSNGDIEGLSCNGTQIAIDNPIVSINGNSSISEGDSGTTDLIFNISLNKPAIKDILLNYDITDIETTANEDYILDNNLTIIIPKDTNSSSIIIKVKGDIDVENNESFSLKLIDATNAIVDSSSVVGTIVNDDEETPPQLLANYHFDKCSWRGDSEEVKDSSENELNGIAKNGANTTDINVSNRGAKFIANSHQYLKFNGFDNILGSSSNSFTITAWIRPKTLSNGHTNHSTKNTFIAKASDSYNDNIEIGVNPNGTLHLYLDTKAKDRYANFGEEGDITLNSWHFIGVSYNSGVVTVQIDDKTYIDNSTWSGATKIDSAINSPLTIGASLHVDNFFDGYIDEVTIFTTPMSSNRMLNIRNFNLNKKDWSGADITPYNCKIEPIGCIQSAFMFQNKPTDINVLNLVNGEMHPIKLNASNDNINAVGFNKKDGYFWGYNYTKQDGTVTRIGMDSQGDWVSKDFKVNGLEGFKSYVGDIDSSGKLYLKGSGGSKRVVVIDLDENSSTYLQKIRDFNLNRTLSTADWAFNAKDNMIYAVNNGGNNKSKKLYQIDPSNGIVIVEGDTFLTGNRGFGAGFFDADGFYYVYDNHSGNIYRIDVANSSEAVLFATANRVSLNDGAMCTDALFKFDFGDLPSNYPTRLESNGARHSLPTYGEPSVYLGQGVSSESNGKPSNSANLDELDDGVKIDNLSLQDKTINAGESSTLKIKTHGDGFLNAWIDWNGDGDFNDSGEQIADNINGSSGEITLSINPPSRAIDITTYARFRYSYQQDLLSTGSAIDGEVEDYKINIHGNLEPFICNESMYLSNRTATGLDEDNSGATWLHRFTFPNFIYTPIGDGFISSDYGYNAIGYNITDNFIYALYLKHLLKIDRNGNIKDLGEISGHLPNSQLYAGEFDRDGYYYVAGVDNSDDKLYKIDISQKKVIQTLNLRYSQRGQNESVKFLDMAIDSSNHYFYAMLIKDKNGTYKNSKFVKIDKSSGVMSVLGDEFEDINSYSNLIFADKNGKVITVTKNGNIYELDPSTGKDYLLIESSNPIGDYNDGTSCPNGELTLPPHLPRLSIGDVSMAEGDSGEKKFRFKVSIDADLPMIPIGMPVMFYYRVIDGNGNDITPPHGVALQSDNDFQGGEGIGINMNVFSNNRETYIEVPVYGDSKVEKDEEFYVDIYFHQFFPTNFCLMGKSRGVGLIINDDLKFNIIRTNANIDDKIIYTQIAGRDFDYTILSSKGDNPSPINNLTIKVKLIDNINNKTLYEGYKYIDGESRVDIVDSSDLKILDVTKDAIFKVYFIKDSNGSILHGNYANKDSYNSILNQTGYSEIIQDASKHFSIRPAGYRVYIKDIDENNKTIIYRDSIYSGSDSLKLSAGYSYMVEADAVALDNNHSKTKGYTTTENDVNSTLIFKDKSSCIDISNKSLNYNFNNSHLIDNISHSNVGKYQLHIEDSSWSSEDGVNGSCIIGSSAISQDANSKSGCNISSTSIDSYRDINIKFNPYRFNITNINLRNRPDNGREYVYMSDLDSSLDMGILLSANIIAEDKNGNIVTNFTSSCEAFDTSLYIKYHITTDRIDNKSTYNKIYTIKGSEVGFKRAVSFNQESFNSVENIDLDNNISIPATKFLDENSGNSSINILLNLNKNLSEPINPVKLEFNSLDINSSSSSKVKNQNRVASGKKDINSSKLFYFASIAPDRENYEDVYENHCRTPISAFIFCDKNISWCSSMIGNNGLNSIKTKYGWYRAYLHNSTTDGKVINFIIDNPLVVVTPSANNLPNFNNGKISNIITGYSGDHLPVKVEIKMDLTSWLKYHREPSRNGIPFWRNTFRDKNATLSGVGMTGQILDISTNTKVAKKIEW